MCFHVKSLAYYFDMKTKILTDFQFCISVTLDHLFSKLHLKKVSNCIGIQEIFGIVFCIWSIFGVVLGIEHLSPALFPRCIFNMHDTSIYLHT